MPLVPLVSSLDFAFSERFPGGALARQGTLPNLAKRVSPNLKSPNLVRTLVFYSGILWTIPDTREFCSPCGGRLYHNASAGARCTEYTDYYYCQIDDYYFLF